METNLKVKRQGKTVAVESSYWLVVHDANRGGCISDIRILYGSNENLLASPMQAIIDNRQESLEKQPAIYVQQNGRQLLTVTFSGCLKDSVTEEDLLVASCGTA